MVSKSAVMEVPHPMNVMISKNFVSLAVS